MNFPNEPIPAHRLSIQGLLSIRVNYRYPYITKRGRLKYVIGIKGYMKAVLQEDKELRLWFMRKQSEIKAKKEVQNENY